MTWTRLHDACQHRNNQMIVTLAQFFAEDAVMVDDHGSTPLHIACWGNPSTEVIQALLQACPQTATDKDIQGNTPLHVAASHPETNATVVRMLLDACPMAASMTNKEGLTPLHMGCRYAPENELAIALMIDAYPYALRTRTKMGQLAPSCRKRIKPNDENKHFVTALAGKSNLLSSETLHGALDVQIRDGSYPLHMAIAAGAYRSVVELILREGDDTLLLTNKHGETPLHLALAIQGTEDLVNLFLDETAHAFAITHVKDKRYGNLPIHVAATHGCSVDVVEKLLRIHPNSIHEQNRDKKTPLDLALDYGKCSEHVVRLLDISDHSECLV